ncbi:MAG: hypothetical protein SPG06_06155 [Eubacteriales bacterium]|nr:hypothetical protein [Eubacteriales bacterium]
MPKKTTKKQTNKRKYEIEKKRKHKKIAITALVLFVIVGTTLFGVLYGLRDIIFAPNTPNIDGTNNADTIVTDLKSCYIGNKENYVEDSTSTITFVIDIDGTTVKKIKGNVGYDNSKENATLVYDFSKLCPELKECKLLHYKNDYLSIKLKNGYFNIRPFYNTNKFPYTLYLNTYTKTYASSSIIRTNAVVWLYYFRDSAKYLSQLNKDIEPKYPNFNNDYYKGNLDFWGIERAQAYNKELSYLNCHFFVNGKHTATIKGTPVIGFENNVGELRIAEKEARTFLPTDFEMLGYGEYRYCASNIAQCYYTFKRYISNNNYETHYATLYGGLNSNNEPALYLKEIEPYRGEYKPLGTGDIFFFYFT